MTDQIDTRRAEHRTLRFQTVDDCIAEVHRIQAADAAGALRTTGNWTAGQILAHVAAWINYAYEGFPIGAPPFFVRWILRYRLPKMLRNGMPRAVRIPKVPNGTFGIDDLGTQEAAERLINALTRLASDEVPTFPSPVFGPLSHTDRIQLNLRHAELHLGFLAY